MDKNSDLRVHLMNYLLSFLKPEVGFATEKYEPSRPFIVPPPILVRLEENIRVGEISRKIATPLEN
jgi:hypothetical protein